MEAAEPEVERGEVSMDEQGDGLVRTGQVGAVVALGVSGQGIGHALENSGCTERRHGCGLCCRISHDGIRRACRFIS
jgi:hypothetical protein